MARRKKPTDEQQEPIKEKTIAGGTDQATPEASGTDQGQESPGVDLDRLRKTFATQWLCMATGLRGIADFFGLSDEEKQPILEVVESLTNVANDAENETAPEGVPYYYMYRASEALDKGIDSISKARPAIPFILGTARDIVELKPYLQEELKKPEYQGKDIEQLALEAEQEEKEAFEKEEIKQSGRLMWEVLDATLYMQAITATRAAKQAAAKETPTTTARRADAVEYPLDKPNSMIWNLLEEDTEGQIEFNLAKYGSRQEILAFYSIDFDDLEGVQVTKRLQPFDKLTYIATAALFNAGNNIISLSQVHYAMGGTSTPTDTDRKKIYDAITKMATARITFDNEQEAKKYKYTRFKYEGALLPCEIGQAEINGKWTDKAIHIFREPPLITFARQRKQITTLDIKLLQAPVSKTDANLKIQDYLLERISKARNGKGHSEKILLKTLYERADIKTKKQIQRAPGKIEKYLKHFQQVTAGGKRFITRYEIGNDSITVYWK